MKIFLFVAATLFLIGCAPKHHAPSSSAGTPPPPTPTCYRFHPSPTSIVYYVFDDNWSAGTSENSCADALRVLEDSPTVMCSRADNGQMFYVGSDQKFVVADTCSDAWYKWATANDPTLSMA